MAGWTKLYQERTTTPEQAVRSIKSGQRVFLTGNCSVPQTVMKALVAYAPEVRDVEICQVLTVGDAAYVQPGMEQHLRVNTLFISDNVRAAVNDGRADFTPMFLSEIPGAFRKELPLDGIALRPEVLDILIAHCHRESSTAAPRDRSAPRPSSEPSELAKCPRAALSSGSEC